MKIAIVVSTLDLGGAQRAVSNIVMNLPTDCEIDLILNSREHIVYPYRGNIISLDLEPQENRSGLLYQGKVFFKRLRLLRKLKREKGYNAVISFLDSANIANILTGKKFCKTIVSVRTRLSGENNWKYKIIVSNLVKLLYNKADKVVAISEGVRQDLIDNFNIKKENVCTIYNCYDVKEIQEKAVMPCEEVEVEQDSFSIATMGRFVQQKGQWHLLRAFKEVLKEEPKAKLYILGEGELQDYLYKMVDELEMRESVIFCGFLKNPFSLISKVKLFVFPSLWEGFGNALVEAMACGVPCIASDFKYGAREIMQDNADINLECKKVETVDYGILTPVCSNVYNAPKDMLEKEEEFLKEAILKVMSEETVQEVYAQKAIERAGYFTAEKTVEQWLKLI
ncbi:glycosyltransferase [Roseburia sp. MSJ-14]|uniref:glycosyltransferase n=1 Tax=Roseburia sp. MSJ-14 TaxID=2841514 RepID=UPI001C119148|nr:glycosyltransferase [Roseburia sp. MSJ-14]MBU5474542.1 glycosyltransferase [Roseburia sp. MSJ-14]